MPIEHEVDHRRRLVLAKGHGTLTDAEVFHYQSYLSWSRRNATVRGQACLVALRFAP
jgi:hypothetical protein